MLRTYYLSIKQENTNFNGEKQVFVCEKEIEIKLCKKRIVTPTYYDRENNLHLQGKKTAVLDFELCLSYIEFKLEKPFMKAKEYLRVLEHRFDWLMVQINLATDRHIHILNKEEIVENWMKMKAKLQNEYTGKVVEKHLQKVEKSSFSEQNIWSCFNQYDHFGFLFPQKTILRRKDNTRNINISEEITFIESIQQGETIKGGTNIFHLSGILGEGNVDINLQSYIGTLEIQEGEIIPDRGNVEIKYSSRGNLFLWQFEIEEITPTKK